MKFYPNKHLISGLLILLCGCAAKNPAPPPLALPPVVVEEAAIPIPKTRKLVAILGFENKSTFASDKLWDTSSQLLFSSILEKGYFRVVEWDKMKQLVEWDALTTSTLVKSPQKRGELRKILLCEYFLSGAVTFFDVKQTSQVSAIAKKKVFETIIRVDLFLQNAATGEYVSAGSGEGTERQEFSGTMSGGQLGVWDPRSADLALNSAIQKALHKMTLTYSRSGDSP
jgi:curli biogenesis system outer membrane secretion channel CsgG